MAFDGITVAALVQELRDNLTGGRIAKIAQPEPDELLLTIKTPAGQRKLYISASASLPLIYLTDAVQDHILVVAENDIAVFAHDLNDQLLLAQIAQFIEMFNV